MNSNDEFICQIASGEVNAWANPCNGDYNRAVNDLRYLDPLRFGEYLNTLQPHQMKREFRHAFDLLNECEGSWLLDGALNNIPDLDVPGMFGRIRYSLKRLMLDYMDDCPGLAELSKELEKADREGKQIENSGTAPTLEECFGEDAETVRRLLKIGADAGLLTAELQPAKDKVRTTQTQLLVIAQIVNERADLYTTNEDGHKENRWAPFERFWNLKRGTLANKQSKKIGVKRAKANVEAIYTSELISAALDVSNA